MMPEQASGAGGMMPEQASGIVPIDGCQELGISYREGCEDCPADPIECFCWGNTPYDLTIPIDRCIGGHCVLGGDCSVLCQGSDAPVSSPEFEFHVSTLSALTRCVAAPVCESDAWCGDQGKCVDDPSDPLGTCKSGEVGDQCYEHDDCWSNLCARRRCSDGAIGASCRDDSDCLSGTCVVANDGSYQCSSREVGNNCTEEADCEPDLFCVHNGHPTDLSQCLAGEVGDPCDGPEQCHSGICMDIHCSSGEPGASCTENEHCLSGFCLLTEDIQPGGHSICGTGSVGGWCYDSGNCAVAFCALLAIGNCPGGLCSMGLCSTGESGSFCGDDSDCLSGSCNVLQPDADVLCGEGSFGKACGDGGVCNDRSACVFAKCH
jgi:hypothetical protein